MPSEAASPLMRGAWIETFAFQPRYQISKSPLMRGAWIETEVNRIVY